MGSLYKGVCYRDAVSANVSACSDFSQSSVGPDGALNTIYCARSTYAPPAPNSEWIMCKQVNGGPCVRADWEGKRFGTCDYTGGAGVMADYFPIALGLLLTVYLLKKILQIFDTSPVES